MKYNFSKAFIHGRTLELEDGSVTFHNHNIGNLVTTSGQIVACDPVVFPETSPFTTKIPPGHYPVILSVANIADDQRVAYAKIQVSEKETVRWEMALVPSQEASSLEEDEIFGYGVDSGTGCFMDQEAAKILIQRLDEEEFSDFLMEEMHKTYRHTWDFANVILDPKTGLNLISFKSGWGDGMYASYFGYDAEGKVTNLVTDFELFEDSEVVDTNKDI